MNMCAKCKKRPAVVFITRMDQGETINEGLCLKCAKEIGLKPVDDIMKKMGITDEDLDRMDDEIGELMSLDDSDSSEDGEGAGHTPPIDFKKLFGSMMQGGAAPQSDGEATKSSSDTSKKKKGAKGKEKQYLNQYCRDLTGRAAEGKLDRIVGRERELERLMQILCRRQKNNPCLIGEPGVGKTAIAEALAQKIVSGDVPYKLKDKEVFLVDLTSLVAGTQFRGQFENRMKGLIEEVRALGNIILVIDEIHSIVGAGDAEGGMNAANIMKPALSRGEIQVIGATPLTEYRKYIEKDAALERRFQPIIIEEPSVADSIEILRGIKSYYEDFHGITIPEATVERAVTLSERYITDRFLPDKAIDLLDEASAHLVLNSPVLGKLQALKDEMAATVAEREAIEASNPEGEEALAEKYKKLADLKSKEINEQNELASLEEERKKVILTIDELARVIEIWTGVPASNITAFEFERIDGLRERLKSRIVGQDEAVDAVVRAIKRSRAGISYKRKPVSFIFAGPTGVGKTELVKTLAADLFHSPENLIRLDMSEFMEKYSVSKIIGSPPGYVGYDDAGQLTEKIRRKPYSVVLFDEIEKAHPDVLNILLQILDDGQVTDSQGRKVNFENTVIVMTTNAGSTFAANSAGFTQSALQVANERTQKALEGFLRPEFLNRVDEIITFRSLDRDNFKAIADIMLGDLASILLERGIKMTYTESARDFVAESSYSDKYGARNMRRFIQKHIEDEIANDIIGNYKKAICAIAIDYQKEEGKLSIASV